MVDSSADMYKPVSVIPNEGKKSSHSTLGTPFQADMQLDKFHKLSLHHARSFGSETIDGKVLWGDEYGNRFTAVTSKGIPADGCIPALEPDPNNYGKFRTKYLLDTVDVGEVNELSRDLRSHGLNTEYIFQSKTLTAIEYKGQVIPINELKQKMRDDYIQGHKAKLAAGNLSPSDSFTERRALSDESIKVLDEYLGQAEYLEVIRQMPVNERLRDLPAILEQFEGPQARRFMKAITTYFQSDHQNVHLEDTAISLYHYMTEILPQRMGSYLARLHKLGYAHGFATTHNWVATGELVDLDGVKKIGNTPLNLEQAVGDLAQSYMAIAELYQYGFQTFCVTNSLNSSDNVHEKSKEVALRSYDIFTQAYAKNSGLTVDEISARFQKLQVGELGAASYQYPYNKR